MFLIPPAGLQAMGQEVDKEQVKELMDEIGTDETSGVVDRDNFVLFQSTKSPTQALPIALFFIQTLALIFKDKGASPAMVKSAPTYWALRALQDNSELRDLVNKGTPGANAVSVSQNYLDTSHPRYFLRRA